MRVYTYYNIGCLRVIFSRRARFTLFILRETWLERHQVHFDVSLQRQTAIRSSDTKETGHARETRIRYYVDSCAFVCVYVRLAYVRVCHFAAIQSCASIAPYSGEKLCVCVCVCLLYIYVYIVSVYTAVPSSFEKSYPSLIAT